MSFFLESWSVWSVKSVIESGQGAPCHRADRGKNYTTRAAILAVVQTHDPRVLRYTFGNPPCAIARIGWPLHLREQHHCGSCPRHAEPHRDLLHLDRMLSCGLRRDLRISPSRLLRVWHIRFPTAKQAVGAPSGQDAIPDTSAHAAAWLRLCPSQRRPRAAGLARAQRHSAHGALHRAGTGQVQKLLARLGSRSP
jgi:hypothetical protein